MKQRRPKQQIIVENLRDLSHAIAMVRAVVPSADQPMLVTMQDYEETRTLRANRRYWAVLQDISEQLSPQGESYSKEVWHEYFKAKFLGVEEIKLPSGKSFVRPLSSADLTTKEFYDYAMRVEVWSAEHGVQLLEAAA